MNGQTFDAIDAILQRAHSDGRSMLFEHEVYGILGATGVSVPRCVFVRDPAEVDEAMLASFGASAVMVKTVSRDMAHNQRYGGVKKVTYLDPLFVRFVLSSMKDEVLSHFPEGGKPRIDGFLIAEFVKFTQSLGSEIMIGLKEDPSFGAVVTLTKGGDDAEFFSRYYDPANLFLAPISYEEAYGITQGLKIRHKYEETGHADYLEMMARTLSAVSHLGHHYSFMSDRTPAFYLKALDVNPLVYSEDGRFIAIDGYAEFIPAHEETSVRTRPNTLGLDRFFHPQGVAILGVSSVPEKYSMARVIVSLFLDMGREDIYCVNPKGGEAVVDGRSFPLYRSLAEIPGQYDLIVYAAPAKNTLKFLETVPENKAVILISGLPSEISYSEFASEVRRIRKAGVRLIGPNCMGVFHAPDETHQGVNTLFIDEHHLKIPYSARSNAALFTQSGAMGITTVERAQHSRIIRTIVSFGNKIDVNTPDLMAYFADQAGVDVLSLYIEGIGEGEGRQFFDLAKKSEKPVLVYKSGRTEAGAKAAASHTAAISGSYDVFKAACVQSGCVLTEALDDFYSFTKAFAMLSGKRPKGNRVAGVVNAGLDATMGADTLKFLQQAVLSDETVQRLGELNTHGLVDTRTSFLDLTPMTGDVGYAKFIEAVLRDENVDCMFVAVVPHIENLKTLESDYLDADAVIPLIVDVAKRYDKPIVVSVNSGNHYQHIVAHLESNGLPVYGNIHAAIRSLDAFVEYWMTRKR